MLVIALCGYATSGLLLTLSIVPISDWKFLGLLAAAITTILLLSTFVSLESVNWANVQVTTTERFLSSSTINSTQSNEFEFRHIYRGCEERLSLGSEDERDRVPAAQHSLCRILTPVFTSFLTSFLYFAVMFADKPTPCWSAISPAWCFSRCTYAHVCA